MECNKDEAIRAKLIAEKKMEHNEFEGARKIVLKAQSLYPELDNINQLLSICNVHCSAQNKLGSEKDWYGILQVEKLADELTVKKQYRKLALSLHPDKNRFPGAEGAFKLICEANTVLSDPTKKSTYDSRIKFLVKSGYVNPQSHKTNTSTQFSNSNSAQNDATNGFSRPTHRQAAQSTTSVKQEVFWTGCPYCGVRYQYFRQFIMRSLRCQTCFKVFVAHEIAVQGASMDSKVGQSGVQRTTSGPDLSQSAASREKVAPKQVNSKRASQNEKGPAASNMTQGTTSGKTVKTKLGSRTIDGSDGIQAASPKINVDSKTKEADVCNAKSALGAKRGGASNGDVIKRKTADMDNKRKRGRRVVEEESSEDFDPSRESEEGDVTMTGNFGDGARLRRTLRKRQHVAYNETDEDGLAKVKKERATKDSGVKAQKHAPDIEDMKYHEPNSFPSVKREQATKESKEKTQKDNEDMKYDKQTSFPNDADLPNSKQMGNARSKESVQKGDVGCGKEGKARGETDCKSDAAAYSYETKTGRGKDPSPTDDEGTLCPDSEFTDFEKVRDEKQFAADQFWACYDTLDGMPRFYAKVENVCTNPFNLVITWLEALPINNAFVDWVDKELPVSCGTFKFGQTEETPVRLSFSHRVRCLKGKRKGSFIMYPRKGEVWALFRGWNINWTSDPENHIDEFKYEVVEVLSNLASGTGIKVCYLDKVDGFVSLFQRASQNEDNSFLIGPDELYRFSHQVPSSKMTGNERVGVPVGSFELDPASLPSEPENLCYPSKAKVECIPNLASKSDKPSECTNTRRKFVDVEVDEYMSVASDINLRGK